jgi:hypothetical protein
MPDRNEAEIVYYRAKSDASGALAVGCILLAFALLVLTQDSIAGIGFSKDLVVMSTYLALPLGVVLILANIRHIMAKGPTMVAMKDGITVLFTDQRVGPLHWTATGTRENTTLASPSRTQSKYSTLTRTTYRTWSSARDRRPHT